MSLKLPPPSHVARYAATRPHIAGVRVSSQRRLAAGVFCFAGEPHDVLAAVLDRTDSVPPQTVAAGRAVGAVHHLRLTAQHSTSAGWALHETAWGAVADYETEVLVCAVELNDLLLSSCVQTWWGMSERMVDPAAWRRDWPMSRLRRRLLADSRLGPLVAEHLPPPADDAFGSLTDIMLS